MLEKVRSPKILFDILEILIYKRKLNLVKYNKKIQKRLHIDQSSYNKFILIKEMNDKYQLNIKGPEHNVLELEKIVKHMLSDYI